MNKFKSIILLGFLCSQVGFPGEHSSVHQLTQNDVGQPTAQLVYDVLMEIRKVDWMMPEDEWQQKQNLDRKQYMGLELELGGARA